ncbi:MAG: hypothetical protein FP814_01935 [Desulfobacterium sp.]|nr:hypothetical protein [Desulfobacterium sp.]MBU3947415.1 hypothetical protein [Pseudomonadota bacterium]MBU4011084.1 hypothetical protein [Pseudomonadota bacterium]MBU4035907.1 hypothetical protein [Pseudomonadota bacterium]
MKLSDNRKIIFSAIIIFMLFSILFLFSCSDNTTQKKPEFAKLNFPESFTFFELGSNTVLSEMMIKKLSEQLGSSAVEKMGTLDLSLRDKIFFNQNFPKLYELNMKLNDETGARVEHNITNLIFRYPENANTPFDNIKLVFSNHTNKPLLFSITSRKKEGDIVDILKDKYGAPLLIKWNDGKSASSAWEINNDFLIFSAISAGGNFKYSIMIYFVNNIEYLLKTEQKAIEKKAAERKKAGQTAF